jgi:hypothetical protein
VQCTRTSVVLATSLVLSLGVALPTAVGAAAAPVVVSATPASAARLPADWSSRQAAAAAKTGVERSPAHDAVRRAVEPTTCGATRLDAYVDSLLAGLGAQELEFLLDSGILDFPTYDALVFGTDGDPASALPKAHRQPLAGAFRDAQRFWDVQSGDISLISMHGEVVLQDRARLTRLLVTVYGLGQAEAAAYADAVVTTVASIPELQGGANPIFTLNAFAFTAEGESDPLVASIPDKIVFGDGLLAWFEAAGLADVGPRVVLAHEFAHHVQFEDDLFGPVGGPEATRRTELMADAMAAYFATHSRGLSQNAKRVLQAEQAFADVGDCAFTSDGHHGTPLQRTRAVQWGAALADSQRKQGHVLPSRTVATLFDAALPGLVDPAA